MVNKCSGAAYLWFCFVTFHTVKIKFVNIKNFVTPITYALPILHSRSFPRTNKYFLIVHHESTVCFFVKFTNFILSQKSQDTGKITWEIFLHNLCHYFNEKKKKNSK